MSYSPVPFSEPPPPPPNKKSGCLGVMLTLLVILIAGFAACYYFRDTLLGYFRTTKSSVVVTSNGATINEANPLPENFPEDIPVYRDLTSLGTTTNVEKGSGEALLYGKGSTAKVLAFYQEQMPQNGWTLTKDLLDSTKTRGNLFFEKADRQATITINVIENDPSGNGMSIKITYGKK